ncbi:MAG: hypothetical protein DRI69_06560, partial [Bacteroidetes bacterium]
TTLAYAALGEIDKAEEGILKLEAELETDAMGSALNLLILCNTMLGNHEVAIKYAERGIGYRLPMMVYLFTEPVLKPLYAIPRFRELKQEVLGDSGKAEISKRKYGKSLLDDDLRGQYQQQLKLLMSQDKPYLDPKLTLRDLAQMMNIPPNQLSQLLNEGFGKNFAEYVNSYRLETFKAKAADATQQVLTILAVAYDSGFNSKTVFNTFFKKMEGKTPRAFWKEVTK